MRLFVVSSCQMMLEQCFVGGHVIKLVPEVQIFEEKAIRFSGQFVSIPVTGV